MSRTVLALSPHLDDAVFSCGGLLAQMADAGWRVCMATAFTRSVVPAQGFALACQLDKGLAPEVDYMALRRAEDGEAAAILGVEPRWLDLPEAPHRGYGSAPELFGPLREDDDVSRPLAALIVALVDELHPTLVLAPQGLGAHVYHRQMIRAVQAALPGGPVAWYRDTPYAIRNPAASPDVMIPEIGEVVVDIGQGVDRKLLAACAYASQVGFQFGGPGPTAVALRDFAMHEGGAGPGERLLGTLPHGAFRRP